MCDTLVALPSATAGRATLFAKNSDRERNEAQFLELTKAARHEPGETLQATYISIPQAPRTHACLLSRPFWMWGAEMGANKHGVVIGNEAVHSHIPAPRKRALTGMDLIRLGLERAASAVEAVDVITTLLETHGQGGDCGHLDRFYYHNSFLIADRREAYVLETVGRWWALERVKETRAISNALSIGVADHLSPELAAHAATEGWSARFDFGAQLIDKARDAVSYGGGRCARATTLLQQRRGALAAQDMMAILRDHGADADGDPRWDPAHTKGRTICMHAGVGARRSQTTGSLVSDLREGAAVHWVTASAAPCLSLFKPVLFETGLPPQGPLPTDQFDPKTRWWRHETFHRATLKDYAPGIRAIAAERSALEATFAERMAAALANDPLGPGARAAVAECWREADAADARWAANVAVRERPKGGGSHARSWARLNHVAGLPRRTAKTDFAIPQREQWHYESDTDFTSEGT
jgi:dipeptidase